MDKVRTRKAGLLSKGLCKGAPMSQLGDADAFCVFLGAELFKPESLGLAGKETA